MADSDSPPEPKSLPDPPTDGITELVYLPTDAKSSLLASTSWDGGLRIHDTSSSSWSNVCSQSMESGPLLTMATSLDGESLFTGGLDGSVRRFDIATSDTAILGHHSPEITLPKDESVACSCLSALNNFPYTLASAGWDKNFYLWDIRLSNQRKPVQCIDIKHKAYSMDIDPKRNRFVVATASRNNIFIDMRKMEPQMELPKADIKLTRTSSLKYQTRVVRFFPDGSGIALGSIEGRVGIEFLDDLDVQSGGKKKYAFKCHRVNDTVYPVNAIAFHPRFGTFATGGCDGSIVTWDGLHKKKLATLSKFQTSISAMAFNCDGSELAIASSYTFEEGERDHPRDEIFVRTILDAECKPKTLS